MGPTAANPGLDGKVEHPHHSPDKKAGGEREHEDAEQVEIGGEMSFGQPDEHLKDKHDGGEPESAFAVGASLAIVAAGEPGSGEDESQQSEDVE